MRVVTLQPFLTDIVAYLGGGAHLVGVCHASEPPVEQAAPVVLTTSTVPPARLDSPDLARLAQVLAPDYVDVERLITSNPDLILTVVADPDPAPLCRWMEGVLGRVVGRRVRVCSCAVRSLQTMYEVFEEVGTSIGKAREGRELTNRIKAQLMDWGDNFYARMKNKRVTVLSSVDPLRVAARWIPDIIKTASALPQFVGINESDQGTTWAEIEAFRPDVIVVAPEGYALEESIKTLTRLQRIPQWEGLPAVKRGEVVFCEGRSLYRPGPKILKGGAVLFSAIAGLESGYITARDEFFRLRFVELHRHRFL